METRPELRLRCCAELKSASRVARRQFVTRKPQISVVHRVMTYAHTLNLKCEYGMSVEERRSIGYALLLSDTEV